MSILFRIQQTCDRRLLRQLGPLIPAAWGKLGAEPTSPENRKGNFLLDTGAIHFGIDESTAREMRLPTREEKADVHGLGGKHSVTVYSCTLFLPVEALRPGIPPALSVAGVPTDAHGMKELREGLDATGIKTHNGLPVIGIIGRSFLQFVKMNYDGLSGRVVLEIDETVKWPQKD